MNKPITCFFVLIGVVVFILASSPVSAAAGLQNAYRWKDNANKGSDVTLEVANPTLVSNPTGTWSYMRVFTQRIISGNVYFVESGWLSGTQAESNKKT